MSFKLPDSIYALQRWQLILILRQLDVPLPAHKAARAELILILKAALGLEDDDD